jgi:hypothetical protein
MKHLNDSEDKEGYRGALELLNEEEELKFEKDQFRGITRWFGKRYLVFGIQHVKSPDRSEGTRKVFFINSVAVGQKTEAGKMD